jgi:hypothetical protein
VGCKDVSDLRPAARDYVEHTVGKPRLLHYARKHDQRSGIVRGRLGHYGIAGRYRRNDLRGRQKQRIVEGSDRRHRSNRLPQHDPRFTLCVADPVAGKILAEDLAYFLPHQLESLSRRQNLRLRLGARLAEIQDHCLDESVEVLLQQLGGVPADLETV